jgi:hypothetical protein
MLNSIKHFQQNFETFAIFCLGRQAYAKTMAKRTGQLPFDVFCG